MKEILFKYSVAVAASVCLWSFGLGVSVCQESSDCRLSFFVDLKYNLPGNLSFSMCDLHVSVNIIEEIVCTLRNLVFKLSAVYQVHLVTLVWVEIFE